MRLRRLDLVRYGCFTDFGLDFKAPDAGKPDFHLVYGPNESGKSTLFSAFLDLLFGIEKRSQYGFLHDYRSMRIAASVDSRRESFDVVRLKRDGNSLLDANDRPLPETLLSAPLGALNRASYTTMFSLDDDSLQSGGESILQSEGDLGRLLFSATSGLSDLSLQLDRVREETDAFYRLGGRATALNRLKEELKTLKAAQVERDTNARIFADLQRQADEARRRHEEALATRDQTRLRLVQVQRILRALPIQAELQRLADELEPLDALPEPPVGWHEEAIQLSQDAAAKAAQLRDAETALAVLREELGTLNVDGNLLQRAERIERLKAEEGRYRGADDIPAREADRAGLTRKIADRLLSLGRQADEDARSLLLPAETKGRLQHLIETASALENDLLRAGREGAAARDSLALAEADIAALGAQPDVGNLERIWQRLRGQEMESKRASAEARHLDLQADMQSRIEALRPWQGDLPALAALACPSRGRVETWRQSVADFTEAQRALLRRQHDLTVACESRRAEIASMASSGAVIDDDTAMRARQARDLAWQEHRKGLSSSEPGADSGKAPDLVGSADAFERAMLDDDRVVASRGQQVVALARLREAEMAQARDEAMLAKLAEEGATTTALQKALWLEIAEILAQLGLPVDMLPDDLLQWMERREALLQRRAAFESAEATREALREDVAAGCTALATALTAAGESPTPPHRLADLMDKAEDQLRAAKLLEAKLDSARERLRDCKLEQQRRARELEEAEAAQRQWQEEWAAVLQACWLDSAPLPRKVAEVREILTTLEDLPVLIEKEEDLLRRIRAMADDRDRFITAVKGLTDELGLAFEADKVLEVNDALQKQLTVAQQLDNRRQDRLKQITSADEQLRGAKTSLADNDRRRLEMGSHFGVEGFDELLACLKAAEEKQKLQERHKDTTRRWLATLALTSLDAAQEACACDEVALQAEEAGLQSRLETEEVLATQLYHERHTAEAAITAVGGDDAVARLEEERRTLLLDMGEQATRYLRLKVGAAAAERALQIYRDRHRSEMMTQAAEAFYRITQGRFSKLTTVPNKTGEVLVGIRANGASLLASEMSKGTRFQLYLALRIAGYHEYAQHHEALPFLADDIMETFDDARSAECFRLFAAMAEKGQVIYLTHHAHLRDLAKEVCGESLQLYELPASFQS